MTTLEIIAHGGTTFAVKLDSAFLGLMEFGSINSGGQYEQDDDEIIEAARERFCISDDAQALVR